MATRASDKATAGRERGFVLVSVLMGATLLVALGSSGLILTRTDLQITSNFLTGTQTLYVAEAGINHAWSILDDAGTFASTFAAGDSELLTEVAPDGHVVVLSDHGFQSSARAGSDPVLRPTTEHLRTRLGGAARIRVERRHDPDAEVSAVESAYERARAGR